VLVEAEAKLSAEALAFSLAAAAAPVIN